MSETTSSNDAATVPRQMFSEFLAQHHRGALDDQLTVALSDLAERVVMEEKSGSLTLKFTLSEEGGGVVLSHEVKVVEPKVRSSAFYNLHPNGDLSRRDPNQPQIPGTTDKELNHG